MTGWKQWGIGEVVEAGDLQSYVQDQVVQTYADSTARGSALGTAVSEGMVAYTSDNDTLAVYNGSQWGQVAQAISPNYIINGAFDIWQRGTSFTGSGIYTADRWRVNAATIDLSTDVPNAGFLNSAKLSSTTAFSRLEYRMESVDSRSFTEQPFILSFWIKANEAARTNGRVEMRYPTVKDNFGTTSFVVSYSFSGEGLSTADEWTRIDIPFAANSNFDKGMTIWFYAQLAPTDTVEYYLTGVQLEAGSVATPFRRNANSIQGELAACQRYYYRINNGVHAGVGYYNNPTQLVIQVNLPVEMRSTPSFDKSDVSTFDIEPFDVAPTGVFIATGATSKQLAALFVDDPSSRSTGNAGALLLDTAGGFLEFDAEL